MHNPHMRQSLIVGQKQGGMQQNVYNDSQNNIMSH